MSSEDCGTALEPERIVRSLDEPLHGLSAPEELAVLRPLLEHREYCFAETATVGHRLDQCDRQRVLAVFLLVGAHRGHRRIARCCDPLAGSEAQAVARRGAGLGDLLVPVGFA